MLGLCVQGAQDLHFMPAQNGLMATVPVRAGALLRLVMGVMLAGQARLQGVAPEGF